MRMRQVLVTVLVWSVAYKAAAQHDVPPLSPSLFGLTGTIDFGVRPTDYDGDAARYERYRDVRSGVFSRVVLGQRTEQRLLGIRAENIGYRDQFYAVDFNNGRARVSGSFDSIPLNYSYLTSSPWVQTERGVFELDLASRVMVQNRTPGVVGVPSAVAQLNTPSIYRTRATGFELRSKRETLGAVVAYDLTEALGFNVGFDTAGKSGNQPYGMSFAFNNANELPIPLANRTNNMTAGVEYATGRGMLRVDWNASFFNNDVHDVVWDNPLRATDTTPYDPNGYVNGNGAAQGRMSMPPDNMLNSVGATGLIKLPSRSTLSGTASFTAMSQDDALIPWTINPAIANPSVYREFPGIATLARSTADASVHGVNTVVTFT